MSGYPDLAARHYKRLHEAGSTLPVVFVSGYHDIKTVVQTVKAGAEDFLLKPVTSGVLLAAIERAIARRDVSSKLLSKLTPPARSRCYVDPA
jgi:FixJ family two-component response regulator